MVWVTTTVLITCADGLLHPLAVTCMFTVPVKLFVQLITPEEAPMLPAEGLLSDQLKPVLFVAVVK